MRLLHSFRTIEKPDPLSQTHGTWEMNFCQQTLLISFSLNVNRLLLVLFPGLGVKGTVDEEGTLDVDMIEN